MKGKEHARILYGMLVVGLVFAMGYLLGNGHGRNSITIQPVVQTAVVETVQTDAQEETQVSWPLDLNQATQTQLEQLPGIGPGLAERIVQYRKKNGSFVTKKQIMDVEGIGEKRYAQIEALITVGGRHENTGGR